MKIKTIQHLVKEECAYHENNFNGHQNYCLTEECLDNTCIYFYNDKDNYFDIRCKYFEECVLSLDKELEIRYFESLRDKLNDKELKKLQKTIIKNNKQTIICECGKEFQANSNRQKFCPQCRKERQKLAQKKSMAKRRK